MGVRFAAYREGCCSSRVSKLISGSIILLVALLIAGMSIEFAQAANGDDTVEIVFNSQGGTVVPSKNMPKNQEAGPLPQPAKSGFAFKEWNTTSDGNGETVSSTYILSDDLTLYAMYNKNPVITLNPDGGTVQPEQVETRYNMKIGILPEPQKDGGFRFLGWFDSSGKEITRDSKFLEDTTLTAHWKRQLLFDPTGGRVCSESDDIADENGSYLINTFPEVEKDGYSLIGWFTDPYNGNEVHEGDVLNLTEISTVYAHWREREQITITFDKVKADAYASTSYYSDTRKLYKGQALRALPWFTATRDNQKFVGWQLPSGEMINENTIFNENTTLTAVWKDLISVTFDYDYQDTTDTLIFAADQPLVEVPGTKKLNRATAGFILEGWYTERNGKGKKLERGHVFTEDTTYYANWINIRESSSTDEIGYHIAANWANPSNSEQDQVGTLLSFHPTVNGDTEVVASLHIMFEVEGDTTDTLPIGSVKIRVPKWIYKDWSGRACGNVNIAASFPQYPDVKDGSWFSYIEEDESYTIINTKEIPGGAGVDATLSYSVKPMLVPGGACDQNGQYLDGYNCYKNSVPISFDIDKNLDGSSELSDNRTLDLEMHTRPYLAGGKRFNQVYYSWNPSWGPEPSDSKDYFYILWYVTTGIPASNINQPYALHFDEDTVHDGSVVKLPNIDASFWKTGGDSTIYGTVLKYPKDMLKGHTEDGVQIFNSGMFSIDWRSGYKSYYYVKADYNLKSAVYPTGEFKKHYVGWSGRTNLISDGLSSLIDHNDEVCIPYTLNYNGESHGSPVTWDEASQTYHANEREIVIRDGSPGDLMYSSGQDIPTKYKWEPQGGNTVLNDDDYYISDLRLNLQEFNSVQIDGNWTSKQVVTDITNYQDVEIWLRSAGKDEYEFFSSLLPMAIDSFDDEPTSYDAYTAYAPTYAFQKVVKVDLPKDTVGFEVRHKSKFYSTCLTAHATMYLKPTDHVKALVSPDASAQSTSIIKNVAECEIYEKNADTPFFYSTNHHTERSAKKDLWELNITPVELCVFKDAAEEKATVFDTNGGTQDTRMRIEAYSWAPNYNSSSAHKRKISSGTFYDLLPPGTTVDESTVFGCMDSHTYKLTKHYNFSDYTYGQARQKAFSRLYYDVQMVPNWQNSGRTMMIINFNVPEEIAEHTVRFYYTLRNTYDNIIARGTTVRNDVAFVSPANEPAYASTSSKLSSLPEPQPYNELDLENQNRIAYSFDSARYIPVDAFSWGYYKTVMTNNSYVTSAETLPQRTYTYRLSYSQSDYTNVDNLYFFDILENGTDERRSEWQGSFSTIDVSSLRTLTDAVGKACDPVVYYSTKPRTSFTGSDFNVNVSSTWSTKLPSDVSKVTAVAVDCSKNVDGQPFILPGRHVANVYITMTAPNGEYIGKTAVNESVSTARKFSSSAGPSDEQPITLERSESDVTLREADVKLRKTSSPESGTDKKAKVVDVNSTLTYYLSISNDDDDFSQKDIVVEDKIPEGLEIQESDITVKLNDLEAVPIAHTQAVSYVKNQQKLVFTINRLDSKNNITLAIPVTVKDEDATFENQAEITSIENRERHLKSETTYHKTPSFDIKIAKKSNKSNELLAGASLHLLDENGAEIEKWTSGTTNKEFNLKPGKYTLEELEAPSGFDIANPIKFTIAADGTVTSQTPGVLIDDNGVVTIVMTDVSLIPSLSIKKTVDPITVSNGKAGDNVVWNFEIENTGDVRITNLSIVDEVLSARNITVVPQTTELAVGEKTTASATMPLTQKDIDTGKVVNTAVAKGTNPFDNKDVLSEPSTATVNITRKANLSISKDVDKSSANIGDKLTYTIKVTNTGNVTLTPVVVSDPLLGKTAQQISSKLEPGKSATVSWEYAKITEADAIAKKIENTASAHGTPPVGVTPPTDPKDTATTIVKANPSISIEKSASPTKFDPAKAGDEVSWSFKVTNTGDITLSKVEIVDSYLSTLGKTATLSETTLSPGASATATVKTHASQAEVDAGKIINTATAQGVEPVDNKAITSAPDDASVELVRHASLAIDKNVDKSQANIGDTLNYTIKITNTGNVTLSPVILDDPLVGKNNVVAAQNLVPGKSVELQASYTPVTEADAVATTVINTASASGTPPTGVQPPQKVFDSANTSIASYPSIKLRKTVNPTSIENAKAGDKITWNFEVTNTGDITLDAIGISDTYLLNSAGMVTLDRTKLAPGEKAHATVTSTISQDEINAGFIVNEASVRGASNDGKEVTDDDEAQVVLGRAAALSLEKDVDKGTARIGDKLIYTIKITNTGNVTLAPVTFDDSLFGITGEKVADKLNPGEEKTVTKVYDKVVEADAVAGQVTNTATAHGVPPTSVKAPRDPSDTALSLIASSPAIAVEKSVSPEKVENAKVGDEVTWQFKVTNTGDTTLSQVAIEDDMLADRGIAVKVSKETLAPNETTTATAVMKLTQTDIDAGQVINQVTASGISLVGNTKVLSPEDTATVEILRTPGLTIEKTVDKDKADIGTKLDYKITIANSGNVTLTNVLLDDELLKFSNSLVAEVLNPGESQVIEGSYTTVESDAIAGKVVNTAIANASVPNGVDSLEPVRDSVETIIEGKPSISIVKTADKQSIDPATPGDKITWYFEVTNTGDMALNNISIDDEMLDQAKIKIAIPASLELAPGEKKDFSAEYAVTQDDIDAGIVNNTATAFGNTKNGNTVKSDPSNAAVKLAQAVSDQIASNDYAITNKPKTFNNAESIISTGDNQGMILLGVILVGLTSIVVVLRKRRR